VGFVVGVDAHVVPGRIDPADRIQLDPQQPLPVADAQLAAGARIVVEAKQHAGYDLSRSLEEADVARRNRNAAVCIFVHSARTAPDSIPAFQRFGHDLVVRWDAEDHASDVWLKAALMVATALSVRAASHDKQEAASFAKIDGAIERIRKHIEGFEEINTAASTSQKAAERILRRAKLMEDGLGDQIVTVAEEVLKLKARADQAE
jgi:hypothetical protein